MIQFTRTVLIACWLLVTTTNLVSAKFTVDKNVRGTVSNKERLLIGRRLNAPQLQPTSLSVSSKIRGAGMMQDLQEIIISKQTADTFYTTKSQRRRLGRCVASSFPNTGCDPGQYKHINTYPAYSCRDCTPGYYSSECNSMTSCTTCGSGQYQQDNKGTKCDPYTKCTAGKYQTNTPTTKTNRACSDCISGQYSTTNNAPSCDPYTTCTAGKYQKKARENERDKD